MHRKDSGGKSVLEQHSGHKRPEFPLQAEGVQHVPEMKHWHLITGSVQ